MAMFIPCTRVYLSGFSSGNTSCSPSPRLKFPWPSNALRVEPAEVADPRQGERNQPVEEFVHPLATKGDLAADVHPLAEPETGDRLAGLADHRLLAGQISLMRRQGVFHVLFVGVSAAPTPMLTTIFSSLGSDITFLRQSFSARAGMIFRPM